MKNPLFSVLALLALAILTGSWGGTGHRKISTEASLSYNQQMHDFVSWTSFLADHASDADDRKNSDPNESARHYIDIDNYLSFIYSGRITQTLDSAVNMYGHSTVYGDGILPWATLTAFDSLKSCFQRQDFEKAMFFAADLGHYVADGHMPLHITQNYNGQSTGNDGIHSRYESSMVNAHVNEIIYTGDSIAVIPDVNQYIFNYLYTNYTYIDSVLQADNYAKTFGGENSPAYKQALWEKSKLFTTGLMKNASHALTELIFTAWVHAGSPSLNASSINETPVVPNGILEQCVPNPFSTSVTIRYTLNENSKVLLQVRNTAGFVVSTLLDEMNNAGKHVTEWIPRNLPHGVYLIELKTGKSLQLMKIVCMN